MSLHAFPISAPADVERDVRPETALIVLLEQLRNLIERLPLSLYQARPVPRVSGSVGAHVRHCLDHIAGLVAGSAADELSYDHRRRGTLVESDPEAARHEIDRLVAHMTRISARSLDRTIRIVSLLDRNGLDVAAYSTIAREVAFVADHTTHHFAIIALLLDRLGWDVPDGFGLAPSTPKPH